MSVSACPNEIDLSKFSSGLVSEAEADWLANHLDACEDCCAKMSAMDADSTNLFAEVANTPREFQFCREAGWQRIEELTLGKSLIGPTKLPADDRLPNGTEIGPYSIEGCLGSGGMGIVYKAFHSKLKRHVALKLLPKSQGSNSQFVSRFEREMAAVGAFSHVNIVTAYDAGEFQGTYFLAMELVDGRNLAEIQAQFSHFKVADACEIVRQVAIGLEYVHQQGTLHRDIKPSNLMLTRNESGEAVVKILDLGLARLSGNHQALDGTTDVTIAGQILGTLEFMPPEQADADAELDIRSDVYSLGATLYKLLSGAAPYSPADYNTPVKMLSALANRPPKPLNGHLALPKALVRLVNSMLSRKPDDRPATAMEVAQQLSRFSRKADLLPLLKEKSPDTISLSSRETESVGNQLLTATHLPQKQSHAGDVLPINQKPPRFRRLLLLSMLPFAIAAGIGLVWLKTDGGYLRIEAPPEIDVTIEVVKDGQVEDTIAVGKSPETIWYRAGTYEIRLPAEEKSRLSLSENVFTLKYRDRKTVTISRLTNTEVKDLRAEEPSSTPLAGTKTDQPTEPPEPTTGSDTESATKMVTVPVAENEDLKFLRWIWANCKGIVWLQLPEEKEPRFHIVIRELPTFEIQVDAKTAASMPPRYVKVVGFLFSRHHQLTNEFVRDLPIEDLQHLEKIHFDDQRSLTPLAYEYLSVKKPDLKSLSDLPRLTDKLIPVLKNFKQLEHFSFHGEREGDKWARGLSEIKSLESIRAYGSELTVHGLEHLTKLPHLSTLILVRENYQEAWLDRILRMKSLTHLSLPNNEQVPNGKTQEYSAETVLRFAALKNLTQLDLEGNAPRTAVLDLQKKLPRCTISFLENDVPVTLPPIISKKAAE
jgi:serine/threonine protein kinase